MLALLLLPVAAMSAPVSLLDTIDTLAAARPFDAAKIGKLTGLELHRVPAQSNEWYAVYRSDPAHKGPTFSAVEVRSPTAESAGKQGMIVADVDAAAVRCVKREEIGDRFGKQGPPIPPSPHAPKDQPWYQQYPQTWGTLRLGYSPDGCLVRVVLDGT